MRPVDEFAVKVAVVKERWLVVKERWLMVKER